MPLFALGSKVDTQESIDPDDILRTKRSLRDLGFYPDTEITDFTDDEMFDAIKDFQRDQGLRADGVMSPHGPTARAINIALEAQPEHDKRASDGPSDSPSLFGPGLMGSTLHHADGELVASDLNDSLMRPGLATPKVLGHVGKTVKNFVEELEPSDETKRALEASAQGAAARLSREGLNADSVRRNYTKLIEEASRKFTEQAAAGTLPLDKAAKKASAKRGWYLNKVREESTGLVKAIAEAEKPENRKVDYYQEKYASKELGIKRNDVDTNRKTFSKLNIDQQTNVWKEIIKGSGRPDPTFSKIAKEAGVAGRALFVLSTAFAIANVLAAENKLEAAIRETAKIGGGIAGGAVAGGALGAAGFNPATIFIGVVAGGVAGAYGMDITFDEIVKYLK